MNDGQRVRDTTRTENVEVEEVAMIDMSTRNLASFDLDVLEDDPLVTQSFPYACLTLGDINNFSTLDCVREKYGLGASCSEWPGLLHLHANQRREAEHKRQAIVLLVSGIELITRRIVGRAYLHEVSRLHELMARAIGIDFFPYTPDGKVAEWLGKAEALTLEEAVTLHIRQAGFPIATDVSRVTMTADEVAALAQDLIHEARAREVSPCTVF